MSFFQEGFYLFNNTFLEKPAFNMPLAVFVSDRRVIIEDYTVRTLCSVSLFKHDE